MSAVTSTPVQNPHIDHLHRLLKEGNRVPFPTMERLFKIAEETIGISADNYLAWQQRFIGPTGYIDGIGAGDLGDKDLMWGYDPDNRPFVVFQYQIRTMDRVGEQTVARESSTLFQRSSGSGGIVSQSGNKKYSIYLAGLESASEQIRELGDLFSGKAIAKTSHVWNRTRGDFDTVAQLISLVTAETKALLSSDSWLRINGLTAEQQAEMAQSHVSQMGPIIT